MIKKYFDAIVLAGFVLAIIGFITFVCYVFKKSGEIHDQCKAKDGRMIEGVCVKNQFIIKLQ